MEIKKTLKEKLKVPGLIATAGLIYFGSLFSYWGVKYKTFSPEELGVAMEQRTNQRVERKANEKKDLRNQFYLAVDADKNGIVDKQEFSHFYDWSGNNRRSIKDLVKFGIYQYKAKQK